MRQDRFLIYLRGRKPCPLSERRLLCALIDWSGRDESRRRTLLRVPQHPTSGGVTVKQLRKGRVQKARAFFSARLLDRRRHSVALVTPDGALRS